MFYNSDCKYFNTDKPCKFHKIYHVTCVNCTFYEKTDKKILIIKLDAIGDVLRTTCILKPLKRKFKQSRIIWLTRKNAIDVFKNNELVDEVLDVENSAIYCLLTEKFDVAINLDTSLESCRISQIVQAEEKIGFLLSNDGSILCSNKETEQWFFMGLNDKLKKENRRTYQDIILSICDLQEFASENEIILSLADEERKFAELFARNSNINIGSDKIVGISAGSGTRWQTKRWGAANYEKLIELINKNYDNVIFILFGTELERDINTYLTSKFGNVVNSGFNNSLREFFSILNLCSLIITGDTLSLHAALGLRKKIVALFGPTSSAEIEMYSSGTKIFSDMECLCCYKNLCDKTPNCMDEIAPEKVFLEIQKAGLSSK